MKRFVAEVWKWTMAGMGLHIGWAVIGLLLAVLEWLISVVRQHL